jgi:hypothetical protein
VGLFTFAFFREAKEAGSGGPLVPRLGILPSRAERFSLGLGAFQLAAHVGERRLAQHLYPTMSMRVEPRDQKSPSHTNKHGKTKSPRLRGWRSSR